MSELKSPEGANQSSERTPEDIEAAQKYLAHLSERQLEAIQHPRFQKMALGFLYFRRHYWADVEEVAEVQEKEIKIFEGLIRGESLEQLLAENGNYSFVNFIDDIHGRYLMWNTEKQGQGILIEQYISFAAVEFSGPISSLIQVQDRLRVDDSEIEKLYQQNLAKLDNINTCVEWAVARAQEFEAQLAG